jgi:type IV secretion system protein VirD4
MNMEPLIERKPIVLGRTYQDPPPSEHWLDLSETRKSPPLVVPTGGDVVTLEGDSPLLTIAPAGSGTGRSCIIPNLLTYTGPVVVIDPTGEAYTVTARARKAMGHTVVRLDPFGVIDEESDALNPFDLLHGLEGEKLELACQDIADMLPLRKCFTDVWENAAFGLVCGVIGYLAVVPEKRKFADLITTFHADDVIYNLAVVLDTIGKRIPKMSYMEIASFLQKSDVERSRILTTITSQLKAMTSQSVLKTLSRSSVPIAEIVEGKPISLFVIVPPAKLPSHFSLLRLWIAMLLYCFRSRQVCPIEPTLVLLDECAQLGTFPQLEIGMTSGGTHGLRIWTFWHDLTQFRGLYPASWLTLLNNCGTVQVFGANNFAVASEVAAALGIDAADVLSLATDEQIIWRDASAQRIRKLDFLVDPLFAGRF